MTSSPDGGAMKSGGGRQMLKKGPWTTAEDAVLMEYVKKHGEGNWNAVQRNSGLMRCGKSCRLRWANHLRPNLRKGAFSPEEERLIVELHSKLGNKWARMAAQLPGRTDNEIKNYWNTRLKRRQRAGLPLYPHQQLQPQNPCLPNNQLLLSSRSPSSPLSALLSAPPPPPLSIIDHIFDPSPATAKSPAPPLRTQNSHHFKLLPGPPPAGALALTLAPSSPVNEPFGHAPALPFPFGSFNPSFAGGGYVGPTGTMNFQERPSIQTTAPATAAPTTSSGNLFPASSDDAGDYEETDLPRSKSGLLEDLLHESDALSRANRDHSSDEKGKQKSMIAFEGESEGEGKNENDINVMDEDIMSLLDNFPLVVQVPDWYGGADHDGSGDSGGGGGFINDREDSKTSSTTTSEATLCWNNMPCIS
ncbi:hypothetical protein DM860_009015 [Cuscuta australis]|uniref:Transcription factor n=1 Tax=Cuscuta australis TaxID=267555 RepID=A0A328DD54_9ASTE|nr:hypothetical protein DM860_009015 [Cuscuta australis]